VTDRARQEYAEALQARYQQADKTGKGRILDEYCRVTHCHRKAAIRRLSHTPRRAARSRGRPRRYGSELLPVLERVWAASDYLCGKLLAPMLPTLLEALERHHGLGCGLISSRPRGSRRATSSFVMRSRRASRRESQKRVAMTELIPGANHVAVPHDRPGLCAECLNLWITGRGGGKVQLIERDGKWFCPKSGPSQPGGTARTRWRAIICCRRRSCRFPVRATDDDFWRRCRLVVDQIASPMAPAEGPR